MYATLGLDRSGYDAGLAVARRDAGGKPISIPATIDSSGLRAQLGALTSQAGSLISQYGSQISAAGQKMTLAVSAPLALGGVLALKFAGDLEQSRIAFETLLGSKPKADAFIKSMQDFAKATPFQYTDLECRPSACSPTVSRRRKSCRCCVTSATPRPPSVPARKASTL